MSESTSIVFTGNLIAFDNNTIQFPAIASGSGNVTGPITGDTSASITTGITGTS